MYVVVFYQDGEPVEVSIWKRLEFVICLLAESPEKARAMGEAMRELLGYKYRVFEEVKV